MSIKTWQHSLPFPRLCRNLQAFSKSREVLFSSYGNPESQLIIIRLSGVDRPTFDGKSGG
jgi:hypothetical protein